MPFWRLFYHIVWSTAGREPLIMPECEREVYGYLTGKVVALGGILHAIGGMPDHIHLVVSVPPKVALSTFVGHIKGSTSHHMNHLPNATTMINWQDDYGIISFAERHLDQVVRYVQNQKAHHANQTLWEVAECAETPTESQEVRRR